MAEKSSAESHEEVDGKKDHYGLQTSSDAEDANLARTPPKKRNLRVVYMAFPPHCGGDFQRKYSKRKSCLLVKLVRERALSEI